MSAVKEQEGQDATVAKMSFEEALAALEEIVRELESGQAPLENSIAAYERGIALKEHCAAKLREAQLKIEQITVQQDGSLSLNPADPGKEQNQG